VTVTLYSKPGCHLCEELRELLGELAIDRGFTIDEINIESDATLFAAYRYAIPVVLVDGSEVARGRIDERQLCAALENAAGRVG
jgi:glutaredoxin